MSHLIPGPNLTVLGRSLNEKLQKSGGAQIHSDAVIKYAVTWAPYGYGIGSVGGIAIGLAVEVLLSEYSASLIGPNVNPKAIGFAAFIIVSVTLSWIGRFALRTLAGQIQLRRLDPQLAFVLPPEGWLAIEGGDMRVWAQRRWSFSRLTQEPLCSVASTGWVIELPDHIDNSRAIPIKMTNPNGITVPFICDKDSDVKLLARILGGSEGTGQGNQ